MRFHVGYPIGSSSIIAGRAAARASAPGPCRRPGRADSVHAQNSYAVHARIVRLGRLIRAAPRSGQPARDEFWHCPSRRNCVAQDRLSGHFIQRASREYRSPVAIALGKFDKVLSGHSQAGLPARFPVPPAGPLRPPSRPAPPGPRARQPGPGEPLADVSGRCLAPCPASLGPAAGQLPWSPPAGYPVAVVPLPGCLRAKPGPRPAGAGCGCACGPGSARLAAVAGTRGGSRGESRLRVAGSRVRIGGDATGACCGPGGAAGCQPAGEGDTGSGPAPGRG
jgi:hypothetical protein